MSDTKTPFGDVQVREPEGIKPVGLLTRVLTAAAYAAVVLGAIWFGGSGSLGGRSSVVVGLVFGIMAAWAAASSGWSRTSTNSTSPAASIFFKSGNRLSGTHPLTETSSPLPRIRSANSA